MLVKALEVARAGNGATVLVVGANERMAQHLRERIAHLGGARPGDVMVVTADAALGLSGRWAWARDTPTFWDHFAHEVTTRKLADELMFLRSRIAMLEESAASLRSLEIEGDEPKAATLPAPPEAP